MWPPRSSPGEPGIETSSFHQAMSAMVVRMPVRGRRCQDELRPPAAQHSDDGVLLVVSVAQASISQVQKRDLRYTERGASLPCLLVSLLRRPTLAGLTGREVKDSDASATAGQQRNRGAAGELDVIGMRSDRKNVQSVAHA